VTTLKLLAATVAALTVTMTASAEPIRLGVSGQGNGDGFRINSVLANTPAADIGLQVGDRIVTVNNTVINSGAVLGQTLATANANGGHVAMLVQDVNGSGYVVIECDLLEEPTGPMVVRSTVAGAGNVKSAPVAKRAIAKNIKRTRVSK